MSNLVLNPGFETGNFTNWTLGGNAGFHGVTSGGTGHSGTYGAFLGAITTPSFVSQVLATSPGATYELTFWLLDLGSGFGGTATVVVSWDGSPVGSTITGSVPGSGWTQHTISGLVASGSSTTLQFAFRHDDAFWYFDDVDVELTAPYDLDADPGSIAIAGTSAGLHSGRRLLATRGAFRISGAIATLHDPIRFTLPEALKGTQGPVYWSKLSGRDVDGSVTDYPWSPITIADPVEYEGGVKDGIMLSIGEIACPLCDRTGRIQVPTCDVTYWDGPRRDGTMLLRGMLGRDTQKALRGKEFTIYAINDRDRRLLLSPVIVFRGYVARCEMPADYLFVIHAEGWIAKRLKSPLWTTKIGDVCPLAPPENFQRSVPVAFGVLSDEGSDAGPIVFVDDESGRGGNGGATPISSYGDLGTAPAPGSASEAAGLGFINLGDNPGDAYYVMYTRIVAGVQSDPDRFLPESITPVVISGDSAAIDASGTNDGADAYRFYIGRIFSGEIKFSHYLETDDAAAGVRFTKFPTLASQAAGPITPDGVYATNPFAYVGVMAIMSDGSRTAMFPGFLFPNFAYVRSAGYNRPVRLAVAPLADVDSYEFYFKRHPTNPFQFRFIVPASQVNGDGNIYWEYDWSATGYEIVDGAPAPEGVIPPIHCGKFTDLFGIDDWDGWLISGRQCWEYVAGYLNGVRIDEGEYGVSILAPGKAGYDTAFGAPPFVSNGFTPYMVFMRNNLRDQALGQNGYDLELFKVNVEGHSNVADDAVETSGYEIFRRLAKNNLVADAPTLIGDWDQEPAFTDGRPRVDDDSIDQAAVDALAVIPAGPAVSRWLSGDMTVDEFLQDICPSLKMKYGIKPNGQLVVCVHNPDADPTFDLDEATQIIDGSFSAEATDQGFANATPYQYVKDYDENGDPTFVVGATEEDLISQGAAQYDERTPEPTPFSFTWRRSGPSSRQVAQAFLRESAYLPQPAKADSVLHLVHRRPGEVGSVTHRQGATEVGYVQRKHAILGMRIALQDLRVGLMLLDLKTDVGSLSFYQYEELMAGRYIGGSRSAACVTEGGVVVPSNWIPIVIDWNEIPGTHGQRARILTSTSAGSIKPSIFLDGEDPSGETAVVEGVNNGSATFDEQLLVIPRATGSVRYWMLPELSGGATAAGAKIFGVLEGYRL